MSANQAPATAMATALRVANSDVPVITSYVNGATTFTPAMVDETTPLPYDVYANAWVDISEAGAAAPTVAQIGGDGTLAGWDLPFDYLAGFSAEYWDEFVFDMNSSDRTDGDTTAASLWGNAYAIAGYVAAKTFVTLLERVDLDTVTWESFIEDAESAPVDLPMAGSIDWADGNRTGLSVLALNKLIYSPSVQFSKIIGLESIDVVRAK
ncbi:hypothetical protein KHQ89_05120 [Mycoplasmatota bacterium]|nr:hypothetical protein KHQ89_05120 [Mycoplasmatota bacterium]